MNIYCAAAAAGALILAILTPDLGLEPVSQGFLALPLLIVALRGFKHTFWN